jgi:Arc/MetJ family transcription regulator
MKRTNLVVDEQLLEEAVRLSGERTYSRTVERALEEFLDLAGSGLWHGDLAIVRDDKPEYGARKPEAREVRRRGAR